jgi:hypothetical protein
MPNSSRRPERASAIANSSLEQQLKESLEAFAASHLRAVVDLDALRCNLKLIRQSVADHQKIIPSVKANGYGDVGVERPIALSPGRPIDLKVLIDNTVCVVYAHNK